MAVSELKKIQFKNRPQFTRFSFKGVISECFNTLSFG